MKQTWKIIDKYSENTSTDKYIQFYTRRLASIMNRPPRSTIETSVYYLTNDTSNTANAWSFTFAVWVVYTCREYSSIIHNTGNVTWLKQRDFLYRSLRRSNYWYLCPVFLMVVKNDEASHRTAAAIHHSDIFLAAKLPHYSCIIPPQAIGHSLESPDPGTRAISRLLWSHL